MLRVALGDRGRKAVPSCFTQTLSCEVLLWCEMWTKGGSRMWQLFENRTQMMCSGYLHVTPNLAGIMGQKRSTSLVVATARQSHNFRQESLGVAI